MTTEVAELAMLLDAETAQITQPELLAVVQAIRIVPRRELRAWDYGPPDCHACWIVAEHLASNTAIAYCAQGFGPAYPWGSLVLRGRGDSMGMDCSWFLSLEDAVRNCPAWEGPDPPGYEVR